MGTYPGLFSRLFVPPVVTSFFGGIFEDVYQSGNCQPSKHAGISVPDYRCQ